MSTLRVTIEPLIIHPHPNADRLELAQVGLYRAVVEKGRYRTGDLALYIPEQAILPPELIKELGLEGKLSGKDANRVKAVRLRGELSQGIVCRPAALNWPFDVDICTDFAELLGITKWAPEIPAHLSGEVESAPNLIRWIEIEDLKRYPDVFTPGEPVVATEKIHGTACLVTYDAVTCDVWVSSKGHGSRNLALKESNENLYWRAVRRFNLDDALDQIADNEGAIRVAVFGEVYGQGVQDLTYGANVRRDEEIGFRAFDIVIEYISTGRHWLPPDEFERTCTTLGIPHVPVLYAGPFDVDTLTRAAFGTTVVGNGAHIREGIVIRPRHERHSDVLGGRAIAKLINPAYLTRKGGTEYE